MRLLGNIEARTDEKGRVFLPASFRKTLQSMGTDTLMLRKDVYQPCLTLYPESSWDEMMAVLRSRVNRWNPRHQLLLRQFLSDVEMVNLDSSGRILIPKRLLEWAGISDTVRFIGMGDCIEMWNCASTAEPFITPDDFRRELEELMCSPGEEVAP